MTDLYELRECADRRITDCDTRNLFIAILDHLIAQEQAASPDPDASGELAKARERALAWEQIYSESLVDRGRVRAERDALRAGLDAVRKERDHLAECMRIAGLQCFMRDRKPDEVAKHMADIAKGSGESEKALQAELDACRLHVARVEGQHNALRDSFESVDKKRSDLIAELDAANARIAELESYKARVEALPVKVYGVQTDHGMSRLGPGRFILAQEGEDTANHPVVHCNRFG